jgi:hypothetical protein
MANLVTRVGDKEGLPIRARDVAFELKDKNVDPAVVKLLMQQAEISHVHDKAIADMASMFDMMLDTLTNMVNVQGNMKDEVDRFRRKYASEDPAADATSFPNQERSFEGGN